MDPGWKRFWKSRVRQSIYTLCLIIGIMILAKIVSQGGEWNLKIWLLNFLGVYLLYISWYFVKRKDDV